MRWTLRVYGTLNPVKAGTITDKSGIEVLRVMLDQRRNKQSCETPAAIVDRLDLRKGSFAVNVDAQSGVECDPDASPYVHQ